LDRALGALFGVVRGVLLLMLATVVVNMTAIKDSSVWRESVGAAMTETLLTSLKPVLPHELNRFLPV
jgi:membrane protein required for colicin V production